MPIDWTALVIFILLFGAITVLGFIAVHWRRGDLDLLHEWGLAGGRFGTMVTWFLLGGDLYTAYTFIAVPALAFGAGAIAFFAVPYTIMVYPFVFVVFPRLWSVARHNGYITASDFVRGRYGSRWLALAVAVTGIVATMPYIALQLVGIQVVIAGLGIEGSGWMTDLPLVVAFVILAAFTYTSGLRAPAAIAIVKDTLIWVTVIAAVVWIPIKLGGYGAIFAAVPQPKLLLPPAMANTAIPYSAYFTLALGSALALFLYPHAMTGVLSASSRGAISRNAALLPAYSFLLALIALLGFMALAGSTRHRNSPPSPRPIRAISPSRPCSSRCSPRGSSGSPLRQSRSARWCRPRSCRSPPQIFGRATSTASSSTRLARPRRKRRWRRWYHSS